MKKEERCRVLFGTVLKYMFIRGITQETLCKRIGMNENTFKSKKSNPDKFTSAEFIEMFDFLGVPRESVNEREI